MEFENVNEIAKALWNVRKHIEQPTKDKSNPFYKVNYVPLEGIVQAVDDAIEKSGEQIYWTQEMISDETNNMVGVKTYIMHSSGQIMSFEPLKLPTNKRDAQAFGSAGTYARRYSLASVFGITSDVDDDGNKAVEGMKNMPKDEVVMPTEKEIKELEKSLKEKAEARLIETGVLWGKIVNVVKFNKKLTDMNKIEYQQVLSTLNKF